jgi:hypothetical protein
MNTRIIIEGEKRICDFGTMNGIQKIAWILSK